MMQGLASQLGLTNYGVVGEEEEPTRRERGLTGYVRQQLLQQGTAAGEVTTLNSARVDKIVAVSYK